MFEYTDDTITALAPEGGRRVTFQGAEESITDGVSELASRWDLTLTFNHPGTFTEEEQREAFEGLFAQHARMRCHLIINGMSDEVVTIVLPQLQELVEHEEKIHRLRSEGHAPHIRDRWVLLPPSR